jgi:uncharacterized protein (TIGR03067 family)
LPLSKSGFLASNEPGAQSVGVAMIRSKSLLLLGIVVLLPLGRARADDPQAQATAEARAQLHGKWLLTEYTIDGTQAPKDILKGSEVEFREDTFSLMPQPARSFDGKTSTWIIKDGFKSTFRFGKDGSNRTIDLLVVEGEETRWLKGIYAISDEELRICFSLEDSPPEAFESKPESGNRLLLLKRSTR